MIQLIIKYACFTMLKEQAYEVVHAHLLVLLPTSVLSISWYHENLRVSLTRFCMLQCELQVALV
jgi:hypothetical protein